MADTRTLAGSYEAGEIVKSLAVAYWTDESPDKPGFHLNEAHDAFKTLAEKMGYRVERIKP